MAGLCEGGALGKPRKITGRMSYPNLGDWPIGCKVTIATEGAVMERKMPFKDALEGMVNGRRVRGRRRYQMIDDIEIYGSYAETKRKAENRKDWRKLVRAVPSQDNRCRHCHNEVETLVHVLGSCPHGEVLRNARHHQVRSIIATALKDADYNTFKEVHGLSVTGSTRRIDIIAFKESTRSGFIIDPTVRFETNEEQPAEVDKEKKNIYNPTIPYYLQKYQLEELEVIGLLVGERGTATLFMKDVFKRLGIPTSIIPIVTLAALKGSIAPLKHHLYSK
ncbi:hypothetical protein ANN_16416 [Periplaneta americana]|uniref:Reverse transcriptase n=1 Tax=Periplaneta americana TaxID=6978 RepID=A0ABQ8SIZ0_PERAM|nr:hypothetical protein ANN_16416 [Periplaneta americana]